MKLFSCFPFHKACFTDYNSEFFRNFAKDFLEIFQLLKTRLDGLQIEIR
jgi:hypothetical protein